MVCVHTVCAMSCRETSHGCGLDVGWTRVQQFQFLFRISADLRMRPKEMPKEVPGETEGELRPWTGMVP
jgi:hypothetical protein